MREEEYNLPINNRVKINSTKTYGAVKKAALRVVFDL